MGLVVSGRPWLPGVCGELAARCLDALGPVGGTLCSAAGPHGGERKEAAGPVGGLGVDGLVGGFVTDCSDRTETVDFSRGCSCGCPVGAGERMFGDSVRAESSFTFPSGRV